MPIETEVEAHIAAIEDAYRDAILGGAELLPRGGRSHPRNVSLPSSNGSTS